MNKPALGKVCLDCFNSFFNNGSTEVYALSLLNFSSFFKTNKLPTLMLLITLRSKTNAEYLGTLNFPHFNYLNIKNIMYGN